MRTRSIPPCARSSRPRPGRRRPSSSPTWSDSTVTRSPPAGSSPTSTRSSSPPPPRSRRSPRSKPTRSARTRSSATFTNCANLLDLCAVAVPAGEADGGQFGVQLLAPAFHDAVAAGVASLLVPESDTSSANPLPFVAHRATKGRGFGDGSTGAEAIELFVAGAHLSGMPLEPAADRTRALRLLGEARTAPRYRLYALDTTPPKPGVVRVEADGASLPGEVWALSPAALGTFLAAIPQPMALGEVELDDGRTRGRLPLRADRAGGRPRHHRDRRMARLPRRIA